MKGNLPSRCEFCGASFGSPTELQKHVVVQHAGRPYPPRCEICGETFESPADLQAHHQGVHRSGG